MIPSIRRADIDGSLVCLTGPPAEHYAKSLSTSVAWHTFEPRELQEAAPLVVRSASTDFAAALHWIHYDESIEPLDLLALRELLRLDEAGALWRVARLALAVCEQLALLHDADIPQLLVHPNRIGRDGTRFVLLPTLAGVLPPLGFALGDTGEGWLHYIAPEVLRTRAMQKELLFVGDVYAFGRTLEALSVSSGGREQPVEPFELARRRVELLERDPFGELPPLFAPLRALIDAMCAPLPSARPSLAATRQALEDIARVHDPAPRFEWHLREGDLDAARRLHRDYEQTHAERVFGTDERTLRLMSADLALMESPPDCNRAVLELERVESLSEYELDVQLRIGRAYALWTTLPRHVLLSSQAYRRAARLSDWDREIVAEWTGALIRARAIEALVSDTADVPYRARPRELVLLRARLLAASGDGSGAWSEIGEAFPYFPFDQKLFDAAREVAGRVPLPLLVAWMAEHLDESGFEAPLAIVSALAGNAEAARFFFNRARAYRPEEK